MNNMKNQFISYELAVKLKELGFDEDCLCFYLYHEHNVHYKELQKVFSVNLTNIAVEPTSSGKYYAIKAPLWQQAFDWFREKYQFSIHIKYSSTASTFCWYIESFDGQIFNNSFQSNLNGYKTYQEARQACLEKLIELCQN